MTPTLASINAGAVIGPLVALAILVTVVVFVVRMVLRRLRATAARFGYSGAREYLRAIPKNEAERANAIELTVRGGVVCLLAALWPLLVVFGAIPFYYGVRKLLYMRFGLGTGTGQSGQ